MMHKAEELKNIDSLEHTQNSEKVNLPTFWALPSPPTFLASVHSNMLEGIIRPLEVRYTAVFSVASCTFDAFRMIQL